MSNRVKLYIGMVVYLTLVSYFFGIVAATELTHIWNPILVASGFAAATAASFIALINLALINRTGK